MPGHSEINMKKKNNKCVSLLELVNIAQGEIAAHLLKYFPILPADVQICFRKRVFRTSPSLLKSPELSNKIMLVQSSETIKLPAFFGGGGETPFFTSVQQPLFVLSFLINNLKGSTAKSPGR